LELAEWLADLELVEDALGESEGEAMDGVLVRVRVRVRGTVTRIVADAL